MEDFNLHLTGDIHAITAANNLVAAGIDVRILHEASASDHQMFIRLFPKDNQGKRHFSTAMAHRKEKLGITVDDPELMSEEERRRFQAGYRPANHHLAAGDRYQRPAAAENYHRRG